MICERTPCTMLAMAMTVVTPMTTPRIVRADRILLDLSEVNAKAAPSEVDRAKRAADMSRFIRRGGR